MNYSLFLHYMSGVLILASAFYFNRVWTMMAIKYGDKYKYLYDWKVQMVPLGMFLGGGVKFLNLSDLYHDIMINICYITLLLLAYWIYKFHKRM